ncbi:putative protein YccU [Burkholderiales bacterium]|nr:MAG: CoA-binding protein [Burkholderiales bacterium]CAG1006644.1 putative protein YccU [Burkholderiales bacterium]
MPSLPDDAALRELLAQTRTIAVVGLSPNPLRPSHGVAAYLQRAGYRVIPVNPACTEVLGERCYASLRDIPEKVDIVDCFRRSEEILPLAREAIAIGAKALWMQLGVQHDEAAALARAAGLTVVCNRCLKIEHARLS